jgi:hypothetical protein
VKPERKFKPKAIRRRILYFFILWGFAFVLWRYSAPTGGYVSLLHSVSFLIVIDCSALFGILAFIICIVAFSTSLGKHDASHQHSKK